MNSLRRALRDLRDEANLASDQRATAELIATLDAIDWRPRHAEPVELNPETPREFAARILAKPHRAA